MIGSSGEDSAHLETVIGTLRRRLQVLEVQLAQYGLAAPTHVLTDQEDTAQQLALAEERLANLQLSSDQGRTPYLGLQTFDETNADLFFGRTTLVADLVERVGRVSLVAVLGASGSGKSSVVRAGLIPLLKGGALAGSQDWRYSIFKPGDRPLDTLAAELTKLQGGDLSAMLELSRRLAESDRALLQCADLMLNRAQGQRLVLVIDQCEELWTLAPTAPEQHNAWVVQQQRPFIRLLLSAIASSASPLLIVLTMRADFLPRAAEDSALASAMSEHLLIVSPMAPDDLREAIIQPAHRHGVRFEAGLVDELIEQVQGRAGALPLLEYTLLELWKRRTNALLTWDAYRQIGGVEGALGARADHIVASHYSAGQRDQLRQALLRLVQPGETTADTRRRVALSDLSVGSADMSDVQELLKPLTDERLLTTGRDERTGTETVEMTHEALIRAWPTLGQWIAEARADLRLQLYLEDAAKEWEAHDENADLLWSGLRLATIDAWQTRTSPRLNEREHRFLQASTAAQHARQAAEQQARHEREALLQARADAERQRAEEQQQRAEERQAAVQRLRRRAYYLAGALAAAVLGAVIAGVFFSIAEQHRAKAEQQSRIANARALAAAAVSNMTIDPQRSLLLATAALSATRAFAEPIVPQAQEALHQAIQASRLRRVFSGLSTGVQSAVWSPDGTRIAAGSNDGTVIVWDAARGTEIRRLTTPDAVNSLDWSPKGHAIAVASQGEVVRVWNADTGTPLHDLQHDSPVTDVAYSPNGSQLATSTEGGILTIWNAETGEQVRTVEQDGMLIAVAWNPADATQIAGATEDGGITLWDTRSGATERRIATDAIINDIAWSPDGAQIAVANDDLLATVWDATSGQLAYRLQGHAGTVYRVAWSPDGRTLASASGDGTAKLWNLITKQEILTLYGHSESVVDVAFSRDGSTLLTGSLDHTVREWSVALAPSDGATTVAYAPNGNQLVSTGGAGAHLWDAASGQVQRIISDTADLSSAAFSPDGRQLATANKAGTARIIDLQSGQERSELKGHTAAIARIAWSPDGTRLATASDDTTVRLWNAQSGAIQLTLAGHTSWVYGLAWSPDRRHLVSVGYDGQAIVWDADSGAQVRVLTDTINAEFNDVAFSSDGTLLALADENGTTTLLDATTGAVVRTLRGEGAVNTLGWSPDGTRIATAGKDARVRVWDAATGAQLFTLPHPAAVYSLAWSPDGASIATASADGIVRIFPLDLDALLKLAQQRTVRTPTIEECREYGMVCS